MYHLNMPAPDVLAAFEKEMEGKQYGLEETWDAFCWFRDGWLAQHTALSETQAQESEDAARYRWFRDECSHDRRVEITEISGTPDMLEHHIDKGRCGL
jgi:hypothetical protein